MFDTVSHRYALYHTCVGTWLWREYDPSKTEQAYEMDPAEREKPYFRVRIYNRE